MPVRTPQPRPYRPVVDCRKRTAQDAALRRTLAALGRVARP